MDNLDELLATYRRTPSPKVLGKIILEIHADIWMYVLQKVSPNDAEDLKQDIILEIIKGFHLFRGNSRTEFFGWCYAISRARIARHYRKLEMRPESTHPDFDEFHRLVDQHAANHQMSESEKLEMHETLEMFKRADPGCFELVFRRHILEHDYGTIGADLGVSADAARMQINRCLQKFKGG